MDSRPALSRPWRMIFIIIAEILISAALWMAVFWVSQRSRMISPFFDWRILGILATTFSQLLMLAVITALWDFKKSVRWLLILLILLGESALLAPLEVITRPGFYVARLWTIVSLEGRAGPALTFALILTLGVASVLLLHVLLWPARNMLGWRVHWRGESTSPPKPQFSLWHLLVWTALIAVLLSLGRTLAEFDSWAGISTFLLLWGMAALLAGVPALIVATRPRRFFYWLVAGAAGLVLLSWVESEFTFLLTKMSGSGSWLPSWLMMLCNGIVATAVLLHVLLLRWLGIVFDLPLPLAMPDNSAGAFPVAGTINTGG